MKVFEVTDFFVVAQMSVDLVGFVILVGVGCHFPSKINAARLFEVFCNNHQPKVGETLSFLHKEMSLSDMSSDFLQNHLSFS